MNSLNTEKENEISTPNELKSIV